MMGCYVCWNSWERARCGRLAVLGFCLASDEFQIRTRQGLVLIGQEATDSLPLDGAAEARNASIGTQSRMPWMRSASLGAHNPFALAQQLYTPPSPWPEVVKNNKTDSVSKRLTAPFVIPDIYAEKQHRCSIKRECTGQYYAEPLRAFSTRWASWGCWAGSDIKTS